METQKPLVLAIPKGRILSDVGPLMARAGIEPEEGMGIRNQLEHELEKMKEQEGVTEDTWFRGDHGIIVKRQILTD